MTVTTSSLHTCKMLDSTRAYSEVNYEQDNYKLMEWRKVTQYGLQGHVQQS